MKFEKPSEHTLQLACVRWFRYQYPEYRNCLFSVPNGAFRPKRTGKLVKDEGAIAGVPDLFLSIPSNGYHGFYVEMKFGNNQLTKAQADFIEQAIDHGYKCRVIRDLETFQKEMTDYVEKHRQYQKSLVYHR